MDSYFLNSLNTYKIEHQSPNTPSFSSLIIRSAEENDLKQLTTVLLKSFHPSSSWLYPVLGLGVYEDIKSRLNCKLPYHKCLVAMGNNKIEGGYSRKEVLGTIEVSLKPITLFGDCLPYISNLAVSASYRRQGVAQNLLERCEQIVKEWGFKEIWLHVLENNQSAHNLYQKRGYKISKIELDLGHLIFNQTRKLLLLKRL